MTSKAKCESVFRCYMTLRTQHGMDHDEAQADISKNLGISTDAVRYALNRAITGR